MPRGQHQRGGDPQRLDHLHHGQRRRPDGQRRNNMKHDSECALQMLSSSGAGGLATVHYLCSRLACITDNADDLTASPPATANLRTEILDLRGFDSSGILISRGGILMYKGNFPESLSQQILAGIILAGRLGVQASLRRTCASTSS